MSIDSLNELKQKIEELEKKKLTSEEQLAIDLVGGLLLVWDLDEDATATPKQQLAKIKDHLEKGKAGRIGIVLQAVLKAFQEKEDALQLLGKEEEEKLELEKRLAENEAIHLEAAFGLYRHELSAKTKEIEELKKREEKHLAYIRELEQKLTNNNEGNRENQEQAQIIDRNGTETVTQIIAEVSLRR